MRGKIVLITGANGLRSQITRLAVVLVLTFCSAPLPAGAKDANDTILPAGSWGGEHISLEVSDKGAELELDCAHGQITHPIKLDKNHVFDVAGTFTPEHGGPIRRDENTQPATARYSGHIDGDSMSLKVTLSNENVEVYTLARGSRGRLTKCL